MDNKHKIINFLGKHPNQKYTMHELSKELNIPYASFYRTIDTMGDLLIIEEIGKSKTISLDKQNKVIKSYLIISSDEERKDYLKQNPIISKIHHELDTKDIVLLFGSYAKEMQTEKSDIDLLIINKDGKKNISFSKYELLFKIKINPVFVTTKEFKSMLKDKKENVGKQALYSHIVLNNPEGFWECVFNGV